MQALQFDSSSKNLSLIKADIPSDLGAEEILVEVAYSGICGTDLHIAEGSFPCSSNPVILGHEFCGVATKIGCKVTHISVGDQVAVDPNNGCYTCRHCTNANYHYCEVGGINNTVGIWRNGGWAQYCRVPASQVYKLPNGITLKQAALTEPLSCISHGWDRITPVSVGSNILIMGAGIIGNLWSAVLHLQGHRNVIVSEPNDTRRQLTAKLETGYDIITPAELKNRRSSDPTWGVDLVIDCSGFGPAIEESLEYLNPGGQLCIFGVASPETKISVSPYHLYKKELTITAININPFSFNKSLGFISAMGDRYLDYERLGIKEFTLSEYEDALAALKKGSIAKAIFRLK